MTDEGYDLCNPMWPHLLIVAAFVMALFVLGNVQ
jgi:hypothetical protein